MSQLSNLRIVIIKKNIDMGTLWWASFFFKRFDIYGFSPLKCVVCNHFVAFFFSVAVSKLPSLGVIMKKWKCVHFGRRHFCSPSVE